MTSFLNFNLIFSTLKFVQKKSRSFFGYKKFRGFRNECLASLSFKVLDILMNEWGPEAVPKTFEWKRGAKFFIGFGIKYFELLFLDK